MKKIIPLFIVLAVVITGVVLYTSDSLQTQVLRNGEQVSSEDQKSPNDCKKMSEMLANDCFQEMAIRERDNTYCEEITKQASKIKCLRKVELTP